MTKKGAVVSRAGGNGKRMYPISCSLFSVILLHKKTKKMHTVSAS